MNQMPDIKRLLQAFVANTDNIRGAIIASSEGLPIAAAFSSDLDEDKVAAITVSLLSLGGKFKEDLNLGEVEKILIQGKEGYCVVTNCEEKNNLTLLVLANTSIVKGWLFVEVRNLTKAIESIVKAKSIKQNSFAARTKENSLFPETHNIPEISKTY